MGVVTATVMDGKATPAGMLGGPAEPGGVGPMTRAMLPTDVVEAAERVVG